jgi:hypothetical protein
MFLPHRFFTCSIRSRLVTFWWSGPGVTTKTKRDNTELRGALSKYFEAPVLELRVNGDKSDFSEEKITPQLARGLFSTVTEFRLARQYDRDSQANDYIKQLEALNLNGGGATGGAGATE